LQKLVTAHSSTKALGERQEMYADAARETFAAMQTQINALKQGGQSKVSRLSCLKQKKCRAAIMAAPEVPLH
jgi:hypothetical protein